MMRLCIAGALALLVAGCGGGGGGTSGGEPPLQALDQQTLVVQMDQNGDNELDLITLDISENPFEILECLYGMPGGDFEDVTPLLRGLAIDPAVSGALATYVGDSFGDDRAELDVTDTNGDPTKVVVFGIGGGQPNGMASLAGATLEVRPGCAAPGDAVLLKGEGFGESPAVSFDGTEARILRHDDTRIVCRVPEGLDQGPIEIDVDGVKTDFYVLAERAPAVVHISAGTATPGMLVFFIGARLEGASAEFWNGGTEPVATEELKGGWCVGYIKVPEILGTYTIVIRNDAGTTGPCSPTLDIVEAQEPKLKAIEPQEQLPGRRVLCTGNDLGPLGFCFLTWKSDDGNDLFGYGFANGYDRVHTWVPGDALAGATYDVTIDFADGSTTVNSVEYTVGTPPAPEITLLEYDEGPAGSTVAIFGHALIGGGFAWPTVHFTANNVSHEALIHYAFGGYHGVKGGGIGGGAPGHAGGPNHLQANGAYDNGLDGIVVEVPRDLADGPYAVTVTVNGQTSNAVTFTVKDLPLTVTSMRPDKQGPYGPHDVVVITGTGFGVPDYDFVIADDNRGDGAGLALFDPGQDPFEDMFKVTVTWQGDGAALEGYVLWHHDREILVIPPGGWEDPLPVGEYTVRVTVERDGGGTETVVAGTYTVLAKDGNDDKPFPGGNSR